MTTHCPEPCTKIRYGQLTAQIACVRAWAHGKQLVWYWSTRCRCWHLTSARRPGKGPRHPSRARWLQAYRPPRAPIPTMRHAGRVIRLDDVLAPGREETR